MSTVVAAAARVYTTGSQLSIGSTHGLGWVGSDSVEIFKMYFYWVGLGRRSKKIGFVHWYWQILTPSPHRILRIESIIKIFSQVITFLQLCQIWHKFDTRGKGYCTKLVGKWVKYNENYLFAGYGDNGFSTGVNASSRLGGRASWADCPPAWLTEANWWRLTAEWNWVEAERT